jgi:MHS family proline/betaine transporter-like MFS transporter
MFKFFLVFVTVLEYFEYSIYAFCSHAIIKSLCADSVLLDSQARDLSILGLAITLLFKPFGAYLIGVIGDKFSRETALKTSFLGMGIITIFFGCLSYFELSFLFVSISILMLRAFHGIFSAGQTLSIKVLFFEKQFKKVPFIGDSINNFFAMLGVLLASELALDIAFIKDNWHFLYIVSGVLNLTLLLLIMKSNDIGLNSEFSKVDFTDCFKRRFIKPIVILALDKFFVTYSYHFIFFIIRNTIYLLQPNAIKDVEIMFHKSLNIYVCCGIISGVLYQICDQKKLLISSCNIFMIIMVINILALNNGFVIPNLIYVMAVIMAFTHTPGFVIINKSIEEKYRMRITSMANGLGSCLAAINIMALTHIKGKYLFYVGYEWIIFLIVSCFAYLPSIIMSNSQAKTRDSIAVEYAK